MKLNPTIHSRELEEPTNYYIFGDYFNDKEIGRVHEIASTKEKGEGQIFGGKVDKKYRDSNICWLDYSDDTSFIYDKMESAILEANNALYHMILTHIEDRIQYTEYSSESKQHYDWHLDYGPGSSSKRKITCVVQLSDPDEYEGGDFLIKVGKGAIQLPKGKGCCIIFPSFLLHKVCPVRKGVRRSLVLWSGGTHLM